MRRSRLRLGLWGPKRRIHSYASILHIWSRLKVASRVDECMRNPIQQVHDIVSESMMHLNSWGLGKETKEMVYGVTKRRAAR